MARVAVIGGSNGGYAMAGDLSLRGHEVYWYVRDARRHADVLAKASVDVVGVLGNATAHPALVSTDLGEVLCQAPIAIAPLPSNAHRQLIADMTPHLQDDQIVVFTPGTILSSFLAQRALDSSNNPARVTFCESATLPYGARRMGPSLVSINCAVTYNPIGVLPSVKKERALEMLLQLYSTFVPAEDVLDAALNNQSPITQPAGMVLNTGYIENVKDFHLHRDGVTPSVLKVEEAVDAERVALRRALGFSKPDYPMKEFYVPGSTDDRALFTNVIQEVNESVDYQEFYDTYMPYQGLKHRYLIEACGQGLVFIKTLANQIGIETPNSDAIIRLASLIMGEDYLVTGRTVEALGLGGKTVEQIREVISGAAAV